MEMTTSCEASDDNSTPLLTPEAKMTDSEGCFERSFSALTVDDVYDIAKLIGSEVERLIDGYGNESAAGLVPKIVKVLELLESFASRNHHHAHNKLREEEELLRTFETLQLQQQKKQRAAGKDAEEANDKKHEQRQQEAQQKEEQLKGRCEDLQGQVQQLRDERQELQSRLRGSHAQEDRVQRQEREVMLKLKEVVDKQRDELRAKVQEISTVSKEVEALQEQLERFMKMNGELRHRQNILQAQLTSAAEKKADMEADLKQKEKEIERLKTKRGNANPSSPSSPRQTSMEQTAGDADIPCFTKKEVRDILHERNELRTNLFLVQEELNYYQREILNDEKCPGFLLDAIRSTIRKQRTVIKAKMLGIPVDQCSSDEEEKGPLFEQTEEDSTDGRPAESRIRNLFGFLTRSGSARSPTHMSSSASTWEIIGDSEVNGES